MGTSILGGWGLTPKFASEIHVRAPNFASKNIGDKYPKFCSLNFRFFSVSVLHLVVTKPPKFFLLFGELGWPYPKFYFHTDVKSKPNLLIFKYVPGQILASRDSLTNFSDGINGEAHFSLYSYLNQVILSP